MSQEVSKQDVCAINEWLTQQLYLPNDIDDFVIRKFLHSRYGSVEETKKVIEKFCITRAIMPEIFTSRDALLPNIQTAFSITSLCTYKAEENEILIYQLDNPSVDKFSFYDLLKASLIQADFWLRVHDFFPEGHIVIVDMKDIYLWMIPKCNIMYFRDFITFLIECMPVRVKHVHVVNCPSYFDTLYALIKPIVPTQIRRLITLHENMESLRKSVDKKYLPIQFGGDNQCMKEQHQDWLNRLMNHRIMFLDDNLWKADMNKKPRSDDDEMKGSFRTLTID